MMPPRHRPELTELMDDPLVDQRALVGNLRDIRRCNGFLQWRRKANSTLTRLYDRRDVRRVLDVATGSADMPLAFAAQPGTGTVEVWATDASPGAVRVAAGQDARRRLRLVLHDARRMPFGAGAFDVATMHMALHHFPPAEAIAVLAELGRVAKRVLVTDLERSWFAYASSKMIPLVSRNRLTRHDGPASVLRAFTSHELETLAAAAGLRDIDVRKQFPARLILTASGGG
jgi:SAM-dependent methyltransferase